MTATELVRDFVNTRELLAESEELATPADLAGWLAASELAAGGLAPGEGDLRDAVELREALRRLLLANTGVAVDAEAALTVLDEAARRARIQLRFSGGSGELTPEADGVSAALGRIVIAVHTAMADGSWSRLKACRASDCEWAFIDSAKNHSRAWCSMRSCGNREKARAFRERRREGEAQPPRSSSR
jgi:predicted RNA-binding Zn ribbon-like protein